MITSSRKAAGKGAVAPAKTRPKRAKRHLGPAKKSATHQGPAHGGALMMLRFVVSSQGGSRQQLRTARSNQRTRWLPL